MRRRLRSAHARSPATFHDSKFLLDGAARPMPGLPLRPFAAAGQLDRPEVRPVATQRFRAGRPLSAFTYQRGERLVEELGHGRAGGDVEVMLALVGRWGGPAWPGASYAGTDAFIVVDYDLGGTAWK